MGLLQQIEETILNKLKALFEPVLTPLSKLWNILKGMFTAIVEVIPATIALVKSVASEVNEWKNFKENISFTGGVINLQSVKDRIQRLIEEALAAWHSLVDLFTGGFRRVVGKPFEDAEAAAEELESLFEGFGKIGLKDFLAEIGPKLEKAGGKIFEVLAIVQAVAEELLKVVQDLQSLVDFTRDVRETFESGEGLFLQQKNKRKTLALDGGGKIKIRVGKLHS